MDTLRENTAPAGERGASRWLRNVILLILAGFLLWVILPPLKGIIILFVVALLFAYLLEPLVSILENLGLPRWYSILFIYIEIGIILYIAGSLLFDPVKNEIGELIKTVHNGKINTITEKIKVYLFTNFPSLIQEGQLTDTIRGTLTRFQGEMLKIAQHLLLYIQSAFSLILQILIVPLIAFFLLKDGPKLKKDITRLIPNRFFEMSLHMLYKTDRQIGRYIRGQILDSLTLGRLLRGSEHHPLCGSDFRRHSADSRARHYD